MIRAWWVMYYFVHYDGTSDVSVPHWHTDIERGALLHHLIVRKYFREDVVDTFERWWYTFVLRRSIIQESPARKRRVEKRFQEVNDAIDKTIDLKYIFPVPGQSTHTLSYRVRLDHNFKGREFIKPHYFLKACLQEFDPVLRFFLGGSVGAMIVAGIWLYNHFNVR